MGPLLIQQKAPEMTKRHKKPFFYGDVYILTNIRTYSSAMDFAMYFADNHMGNLVGEASGNLPNAYGQCVKFRTPNSRLAFTVSVKRRHRIDMSKDSERIMPDYECPGAEAMDKAYELILGR